MINRDKHFPHLRKKFHSQDIKKVIKDKKFFANLFADLKEEFGRDFKKDTVDLVTGGPPCQGFSGIGIRRARNPREFIFDRELPKYTQIGNAVPVKLAYEIGKHFLSLI